MPDPVYLDIVVVEERKRWLKWMGSSLEDLRRAPHRVRSVVAYALYVAERGGKHQDAKPLHGFGGASVLEIAYDCEGDAYRVVYTVLFEGGVYVLHCFQKKSKSGIETPKSEMDLIRLRLKMAKEDYSASR